MSKLNFLLIILLLLVVGATWMLQRNPSMRQVEFIPGMFYSVPADAQSKNHNFADGKELQVMPRGTIQHRKTPLHYVATAEDEMRAGNELNNPFYGAVPAVLQRGEKVFTTFCSPCHGAAGLGDGIVVTRGYPPPPSLLAENARNMKDGQMFHIISFGRKNMPSYSSQIATDDRWKVICYVRSLQPGVADQIEVTTK